MTREEKYIEYDERINRYLRNLMDDNERTAFEQDVVNDQELRERLVATAMLVKGIAKAGMQQEGQAQLDAIKQMSQSEFNQATQGVKIRKPMWSFMKWAAGIAAVAFLAYGLLYTFFPTTSTHPTEMAEVVEKTPVKPKVTKKPVKPTLASLADEYNKPFADEPDEFISIRQQIKKGGRQKMLTVIDNIDIIEWPTAKHGYKGASDNDETKYTTDNFNDCSHWYKALAYLKRSDKENAVNELNELIDHGRNEVLVERATDLLRKLKQ